MMAEYNSIEYRDPVATRMVQVTRGAYELQFKVLDDLMIYV